jgi:hypothetical protein
MQMTILAMATVALFVAGPLTARSETPHRFGVQFGTTAEFHAGLLAQEVAQPPRPQLSDAEIEHFLLEARVVKTRSAGKGVTGSLRATLTDGVMTHDAHIQSIDERKTQFDAPGAVEFNFRDSWMYNVAAYRLDRMLGLNFVPVSVSRRWRTAPAAFTWWVDDVMMEEGERLKKKMSPARPAEWNEEMQLVRLFDQLIYNVDRNLGNLLITKDWRVWAIDHTRAFRTHKTLKSPANVTRCDRQVLQRLKDLDRASLKRELGDYLSDFEIDSMLARRDAIVAMIDKGGPGAVFERMRKSPVGT